MRFILAACLILTFAAHAGQPAAVPAPTETRTGDFQSTFKERSPFSAKAEMDKRMPFFRAGDYDLAAESFEVHVPSDYKPGGAPYGLIVFINSGDDGKNNGNFKPLLSKYKMIWIGANKAGNERAPLHRVGLALDAVHNMKKLYNIDTDRIYLSGISGGGRASSGLAPAYPDVFNGAIYLIGCNATIGKPPPQFVDKQKRLNSYVFITGTNDFNKGDTNGVLKNYKSQKFERTLYLEVPGMGHDMPPTDWLEKGINYVDEPLTIAAAQMLKSAQDLEKREKFGQALVLYRKAASRGSGPDGKTASEKVVEIEKKREELLASAKQLIADKKGSEAAPILEKMLRTYETECGNARELLRDARK